MKGDGSYIVCVRDTPGGEDDYLGPYRSEERAQRVAARLRKDFEARGAGSDVVDAIVEWVRPAGDIEEYREALLRDLEESGFPVLPKGARNTSK